MYIVVVVFFLAFQAQPLTAGENDPADTPDSETITNAAQEQHALNLAESAALMDSQVSSLKEYLEYAEKALEEARKTQDEEKIEKAQIAYDSALSNFEEAFARETESQRADITAMRRSGMGWGEIAHKLGVHPGVLGLGHSKKQAGYQATEGKQKTSRGSAASSGKGRGLGLGHSKGDSGHGKSGHGGGHGGGHGCGKK